MQVTYIVIAFHVGLQTVYEGFKETCDALVVTLELLRLPKTTFGMYQLDTIFKTSRAKRNPVSSCIGAIEGITIKIRNPSDMENTAAYYGPKGFYALPVQDLVDSDYRLLESISRYVGSTYDSMAHAVPSLGMYLALVLFDSAFWIAVDEAYSFNESLITTCPISQAGPLEQTPNFLYLLCACM